MEPRKKAMIMEQRKKKQVRKQVRKQVKINKMKTMILNQEAILNRILILNQEAILNKEVIVKRIKKVI